MDKVKDILKIGQDVEARVIKVDRTERRIGLSIKAANYSDEEIKRESEAFDSIKPGEDLVGLEQAFQAAQPRNSAPAKASASNNQRKGRTRLRPPVFFRDYAINWREPRQKTASPSQSMEQPQITAYLKTQCGWSRGVRAVLAQVRPAVHGKGHHPEPGVPLGDGAEKRPAALSLRGGERHDAAGHLRRRTRALPGHATTWCSSTPLPPACRPTPPARTTSTPPCKPACRSISGGNGMSGKEVEPRVSWIAAEAISHNSLGDSS